MEAFENYEENAQSVQEPVAQVETFTAQPEAFAAQPEAFAAQPVVQKPKKKGKFWKGFLAFVLAAALVAGSAGATAFLLGNRFDRQLSGQQAAWQQQMEVLEQRLEDVEKESQSAKPGQTQAQTPVVQTGRTPAVVYGENAAKVVLIKSTVQSGNFSSGVSTGSGFVLTADGYVVTNHHVVEGGTKLSVVMADNQEYEAKLIGSDNANDVALLKIEAENLPFVELGDSDAVTVGDQVVAIGNPLGELTSTLTVGYVSAKERDVNTSGFAINMIQTDAAINSGNSGGPLFNMAGQVIGITTAKYSGSSSSGATIEGIGFAIPINDVAGLLEDLATKGYVSGPYLGISVSDMDAAAAEYLGIPAEGAYVNEVVAGSCAEKAGMKAKDIIRAVGEYSVTNVNSLSRALRNFAPGDTVEITVYRGGMEKKLTVVLDEKPREEQTQEGLTQLPEEQGDWMEGLFPGIG